ncbi:Uma2 family endonuclease [Synechocystis salina]|uniref:Uma2 family endonuclease n=1 Tax=Synechocystis salina LEGE 00031 TaxID=1828736 RepID=A0ABR9VTD4_9SYNC|nr:Uma2 family endonuclease [Synechocystis salina]MBE9240846.1 Uma2 family endonuclease [Synechocystis salina LEGE 00041]MBE9254306.1 Uma2 family endonuclease [Synechocystis salina LEGE 00031]
MLQIAPPSISLEDFLNLPETKPAKEYLEGQVIQKPMPQGKHSVIQGELVSVINASLKVQKIARAFPELRCTFGGRSIVPDLSIFTWSNIPREANGEIANSFLLAPNWAIEILSPDQSQTRVIRNILHCLNHGTQMGWLIDPDEQIIFTYTPGAQTNIFAQTEQIIPVPTFASTLQISLGLVFNWLLE